MVKETELEEYYRQIEKALGGNQAAKAQILKTAKCDMEEFLEEFPDAAMEDLVKRFGTPEDYAKEYVSGLDSGELAIKLNVAKFWKTAIRVGVVTVVGIVAAAMIWIICANNRDATRYYDEDVRDGTISTTYVEEP